MMKKPNYYAIIGDVVLSREVEDREALQARMQSGLDDVNQRYVESIASRFILTTGDEFQGLLTSHKDIDEIVAACRNAVHPTQLRFGIGYGLLNTTLRPDAIGMDGPCFHRARSAIEGAKQSSTLISVNLGDQRPCLEIYALLYSQLRWGWTDRQRQVIDLLMAGWSGKEISTKLGITASAVSQHRHAAGDKYVRRATELWRNELSMNAADFNIEKTD